MPPHFDRVLPIIAEYPQVEAWRRLRLFLAPDFVTPLLSAEHGSSDGKNLAKQARQIADCVRQGEEYFQAASSVSLATKPVLLYYGAVALTRTIVLVRRDGMYSFDALRAKERHSHHGLEVGRGALRSRRSLSDGDFLKTVQVKAYFRDMEVEGPWLDGASVPPRMHHPWGHYPLVYESLLAPAVTVPVEISDTRRPSSTVTRLIPVMCADMPSLDWQYERSQSLLDLMGQLPDLFFLLHQVELPSKLCRGRVVGRYVTQHGGEPPAITRMEQSFDLFADGVPASVRSLFINTFPSKSAQISVVDDHGANLYLRLHHSYDAEAGQGYAGFFPDVVETADGRHFFHCEPDAYLPELAIHLQLLFALSMLARYYPDLWMDIIGRPTVLSVVLDAYLEVASRKLPTLVLDQLTRTKHVISTSPRP